MQVCRCIHVLYTCIIFLSINADSLYMWIKGIQNTQHLKRIHTYFQMHVWVRHECMCERDMHTYTHTQARGHSFMNTCKRAHAHTGTCVLLQKERESLRRFAQKIIRHRNEENYGVDISDTNAHIHQSPRPLPPRRRLLCLYHPVCAFKCVFFSSSLSTSLKGLFKHAWTFLFNHRIEKFGFLGILRYKLNLKLLSDFNLYRGIWVLWFGGIGVCCISNEIVIATAGKIKLL